MRRRGSVQHATPELSSKMGEQAASRLRVLIIAYLFPPSGGISVQRALSLARFLPSHGFDIHVLKGRNAASPSDDPSLLQHVPASVTIHEAFSPEIPFAFRQKVWKLLSRRSARRAAAPAASAPPAGSRSLMKQLARRIFCPEPEILWVPFALRKARRIIRENGIQAVLITVPPFSTLEIGTRLKREFPALTFISDFRDEWLTFYVNEFDFQNDPHTKKRAAEIERAAVTASDLVVAVTQSSKSEIRKRYPELPESRFACLHNGYDPELIPALGPRRSGEGKVIVTHVGTVYKTASPRYYLDALDRLPEAVRSRFETRFIGRIAEEERAQLENRKSAVRLLGFMPQREAIQRVEETDYLLLTMTNDISLPGKLFEYLAMGRPILALTQPRSEVEQILQETGTGICADFADPEAIQRMLEAAQNGCPWFQPKPDAIRRYERSTLTAAYAELISSAVGERAAPPSVR
jgi:glycosyltransferase involved in cell wall biosynthesis